MSRFFIDRPIFAAVLSIIITLAGGIAVWTLPIAQYPDITPPTVEVTAFYPGANANVVADTVAAPIEQQVNGVENMMYMSSQCTNDGMYTLTITFKIHVDLDMAQVLVQNRVSLAEPILPDLVKRRGVSVKKKSPSILMIVNLFSPDGSRDSLYLSNYATIQLRDELSRLDGVGGITYMGQRDYSMRVWLDPGKMAFRNLTSTDVTTAIEQQNAQVAAGQIGQPPVPTGQVFQYTMTTLGRLIYPNQFDDMILKTDATGRIVRLRDVARTELGAQGYDQTCTLDGKPSVALSIYQRPGSNALDTARLVREKMEELKGRFPKGLDYSIVYDTTPFITESVNEVFNTLRDAVILVAVVVLLFLQNWRSAVIPLIAVPVAIIGTFAVMAAMGFSLNNLTLFGLVLAIGIVVDDAIVVVEAVEHHIEHGMSPRDATIQAMDEVSGPVIAIGLVLAAVFVPCAFISGIIGQFFRQFALTIATSTLISAFNSLTLSPALAALLLRPKDHGGGEALPRPAYVLGGAWAGWKFLTPLLTPYLAPRLAGVLGALPVSAGGSIAFLCLLLGGLAGWILSRPLNFLLGGLFRGFNAAFRAGTEGYARVVGGLLRVSALVLLGYGGLLYMTYWGFTHTPSGFIPSQDKGYLLVNMQLPDSTSVEKTQSVMRRAEEIARRIPGVSHTLAVSGQSILLTANAPNFGAMYVMLDDFHRRTKPGLSGDAISARLQASLQDEIEDGLINVFGAPPVEGLGTAGGFKVVIEDRGDLGSDELQATAEQIVGHGNDPNDPLTRGKISGLFTSFRANTPWLFLDIDRSRRSRPWGCRWTPFSTRSRSTSARALRQRLQRVRPHVAGERAGGRELPQADRGHQAASKFATRAAPMVPLAAVAGVRDVSGPVMIVRYNMYPAAAINGNPSPGVSSGQAIGLTGDLVRQQIPQSMRFEWTELALLQLQTGNTAMIVFVLAVVLKCFPRARRAVRKLVAAAGRHPCRADVPALLDLRRAISAPGHQHLHSGRVRRVGGPGVQERDPDRRVRQGPDRGGRAARPGHPGSVPAAAATHHDDVVRLHPRRGSAGCLRGRGRRDAANLGHGRLQRHAWRDPVRDLPHPRVLFRDPVVQRPPRARRPSEPRQSARQ